MVLGRVIHMRLQCGQWDFSPNISSVLDSIQINSVWSPPFPVLYQYLVCKSWTLFLVLLSCTGHTVPLLSSVKQQTFSAVLKKMGIDVGLLFLLWEPWRGEENEMLPESLIIQSKSTLNFSSFESFLLRWRIINRRLLLSSGYGIRSLITCLGTTVLTALPSQHTYKEPQCFWGFFPAFLLISTY